MTDVGRTLYKRDSTGKIRVWRAEHDGNKHRVVAGLKDGAQTESGWTVCTGKQGRSDEQQAEFEVNALYEYNLKREYFETEGEVDTPRFFKPMLAQKWSDFGWDKAKDRSSTGKIYSQPKLDGFCCIAQASGLTSREGQPIVSAPHIMRALGPFFAQFPEARLHGELYNHDLRDDFQSLSSILKKQKPSDADLQRSEEQIQLHVYDYPAEDLVERGVVYSERHRLMEMDLAELRIGLPHIVIVPMIEVISPTGLELQRVAYVDAGYEGQMAKLDLPYEQKRSWGVLKNKVFDDHEFEVVELVDGKGNFAGYPKRVTCRTADGRTFGAGIKGKKSDLLKLRDAGHKVVTIRYFGLTNDGLPRMGVATKWHGEGRTL